MGTSEKDEPRLITFKLLLQFNGHLLVLERFLLQVDLVLPSGDLPLLKLRASR